MVQELVETNVLFDNMLHSEVTGNNTNERPNCV